MPSRPNGASGTHDVVDILTLALTHGLMAVALWRLLARDDLGRDGGEAKTAQRPWLPAPPPPGEDA